MLCCQAFANLRRPQHSYSSTTTTLTMLNRTTTYDSLGPGIKRSHLNAKAPSSWRGPRSSAPPRRLRLPSSRALKWLAAFCMLDNVLGAVAVAPSKTPAVLCSDECLADSSVPVRESSQLQNLKPLMLVLSNTI